MIKKSLTIRQDVVYEHPWAGPEGKSIFYRRMVGGLGWPWGPEPGYLVVLAEETVRNESLKARKLWVLAERQVASIAELHQGCLELRHLFCADNWLAEVQQREAVQIFYQANRELKLATHIYLQAAHYAGEKVALIDQLIGQLTQKSRKVLHFGKGSKLSAYLSKMTSEDFNHQVGRFPPLAALGYAVAEMVLREPADPKVLNQKPITTWDPMQWVEARG